MVGKNTGNELNADSKLDLKALLAGASQPDGAMPADQINLEPYPVGDWHPERVYGLPLEIRADNSWHYMGEPLNREATRRMFARIMSFEDGAYYLKTPAEQARIRVADAPFQIMTFQKLELAGQSLIALQPDYAPAVALDSTLTLTLRDGKPYVQIRDGLEARLSRAVYYQLAALAEPQEIDGVESATFESGGVRHSLGAVAD